MSQANPRPSSLSRAAWAEASRLINALRPAAPALLFGLRLWASVCLALYVAFWLELDNPSWAGTSAAIVCQPHLGASLRKGWFRMVGTIIGGVAIVVLTACFPQDRAAFLLALAAWGGACALLATLLRNFAAYSAALAGYTAAIIASDQLGAVGGLNGQAFTLAISRTSEICLGIVCAGIVLAATDFGGARRQLATLFSTLVAEITSRFTDTLSRAGPDLSDTQPIRWELLRRVIALDPLIDEGLGESAQLRYHSPVLQGAVDGLFAALAGWRTVVIHLLTLPIDRARAEARTVLQRLPPALLSTSLHAKPADWLADPTRLREICDTTVRSLAAQPANTRSQRLLADQTAALLAGISQALGGLALLVDDPTRPAPRTRPERHGVRLHVPDWLPALLNTARAFATIVAIELIWIITQWPNGADAIIFAAVGVILLGNRADQAYVGAINLATGTCLAAIVAAIVDFAVLPRMQGFAGFSLALGLVLVPAGMLVMQSWQTAVFTGMTMNFIPLLGPTNPMSYDTQAFYNDALALCAGISAAALSFRLLPPLPPALRTRRLLDLTRRDLRRLAAGTLSTTLDDWRGRIYSRLSVLPDVAEPVQRAQALTAFSVGNEIIQLRPIARQLRFEPELLAALAGVARGDTRMAITRLSVLAQTLAERPGEPGGLPAALTACGCILAMVEALTQHAAYFDTATPA